MNRLIGVLCLGSLLGASGVHADYLDRETERDLIIQLGQLNDESRSALRRAKSLRTYSYSAVGRLDTFSREVERVSREAERSFESDERLENRVRQLIVQFYNVDEAFRRSHIDLEMAEELNRLDQGMIKLREIYGGGFRGDELDLFLSHFDSVIRDVISEVQYRRSYDYREREVLRALYDLMEKGRTLRSAGYDSRSTNLAGRLERVKFKKFLMEAREAMRGVSLSSRGAARWSRANGLYNQVNVQFHIPDGSGRVNFRSVLITTEALSDLASDLVREFDRGSRETDELVRSLEDVATVGGRLCQQLRYNRDHVRGTRRFVRDLNRTTDRMLRELRYTRVSEKIERHIENLEVTVDYLNRQLHILED